VSRPDTAAVQAAAEGVVARLGDPVRLPVRVYSADAKRPLAEALVAALAARGLDAELVPLSTEPDRDPSATTGARAMRLAAATGSLVILADPPQAPWLFEIVGRPDRGLQVAPDHLYCDWLLPYHSLIRVLSADYACVHAWRERLLDVLQGASDLCVQTGPHAELTLAPRTWIAEDGEVFTAPCEKSVEGTLVVDGAVYDSLPRPPIELHIVGGRVVDLHTLVANAPCQRMLHADLTRDANAAQVAELGLGINPAACARGHIMEAEMALGTCHVGFGHNLAYGGLSASITHVDVGLLRPTIKVDGRVICREGRYQL
jgi:leucyl aminopeptidase (aminopeptidase T)